MPGTKSKKVVETKAETPVKAKKEKAVKTEYVYALEPLPEKILPPTEFSSESEGGKSIEFIINDSLSELPKLPKAHFDLIFVDGNHTWDYILKEFKIVENLLARGGVIVYHDSIKIDDVAQLVKYAQQFKYKAVTLNTPDGHGLSIIQKY